MGETVIGIRKLRVKESLEEEKSVWKYHFSSAVVEISRGQAWSCKSVSLK